MLVKEEKVAARELPQDVVSLVHHVHLNQQGWWRKGVVQILAGLLWKSDSSWSAAKLKKELFEKFNVSMASDEIQDCLKSMSSAGTLNEVRDGEFRLSEVAARDLASQAASGEAEIQRAKNFFVQRLSELCGEALQADQAWTIFVDELTLAVRHTGASTFNLLTGEALDRHEDWLIGFVNRFGDQYIDSLKQVVASFFSSANPDGKQYTLRLLSAYFFVESTQLSRRTIDSIDAKRSKRKLSLYLDSNFIFSVLGLHDNPADDAALSLLELAKSAKTSIDINFFITPSTLEETQRTIHACMESAKRVQVSRALQVAASTAPLPSALRKYFSESAKTSHVITAEEFFGPYARNLKTVLQAKGIQVDNEIDISKYRTDQRIVDDVLNIYEREQSRKVGRPKTYEAIEHDVILWHVVNDQRPKHTESPFDAEVWIVTVDTRLTAFDRRKTPRHMGVPTALLPSNLAQLIQFWVPRSEQLEATLLDSLKLPLFFREFDREDEQVTMRILGALSRYEDVDDLGVETVRKLLVNEVLRQRIEQQSDATDDDDLGLIRDEVIEINKHLSESLSESQVALKTVTARTTELQNMVAASADKAANEALARVAANAKATTERDLRLAAENALAEERGLRFEQGEQIASIQAQLAKTKIERARNFFVYRYCVGIPAAATAICWLVSKVWHAAPLPTLQPYWPQLGYGIAGALTVLAGAFLALRFIRLNPELEDWGPVKYFKRAAFWTGSFFGSGVLPGFVGDAIKKLTGIS